MATIGIQYFVQCHWLTSLTQQMQKTCEYVYLYYGIILIELFNLKFLHIYQENVLMAQYSCTIFFDYHNVP